jgi:hypothetical protein
MNTPFWGFLAADTALPPTPSEIFEKDVNPIAVRPMIPKRAPSFTQKENEKVFDVLGRRVSSVAQRVPGQRMAPGMYIDKTQSRIRKILGLQNR